MIHQYKLSGYNIVLDVYSGSVHAVDDVAYDAIALIDQGSSREQAAAALAKKYAGRAAVTESDINDVLDDIDELTARILELAERGGLTPRETEVFVLLAQGRTRAFIQDELVLSGSTVKTHVSHIYAKMGVHDRQEMMDLIWG